MGQAEAGARGAVPTTGSRHPPRSRHSVDPNSAETMTKLRPVPPREGARVPPRLRSAPVVLLLAVLASACSTTSTSFVEDQSGFSVTKGRVLRIENLESEDIETLADGVAFRMSRGDCRVTIEFPDGRKQHLTLPPGGILVCAHATDYVLRMEDGGAGGATRQDSRDRAEPARGRPPGDGTGERHP